MAAILDITLNTISRMFSGHMTMSAVHLKPEMDKKVWISFNSVKNDINLLFDHEGIRDIFDFTHHNVMPWVFSGQDGHLAIHWQYNIYDAFWPHHYVRRTENPM